MNIAKKPEVILSAGTAAALVGVSAYTVKSINYLNGEISSITTNIDAIGKRLSELKISELESIRNNVSALIERNKRLEAAVANMAGFLQKSQECTDEDNEQLQEFFETVKESIEKLDKGVKIRDISLSSSSTNSRKSSSNIRRRSSAKNVKRPNFQPNHVRSLPTSNKKKNRDSHSSDSSSESSEEEMTLEEIRKQKKKK